MLKCECCGREFIKRDEWDGYVDISEFCIDCRDNRCDAYPGTCPNKVPVDFHTEVMNQIWSNSKDD